MKEAVRESLVDESCGKAGLWCKAFVCGFAHWKLSYALPVMRIRPRFLKGSNEAER
jgi:hypothetical protein